MSLLDLPFSQILEAWDDYDKGGTYLPGIRALTLEDRYYLLVKVMGRVDMLHPWVYERCREVQKAPDGYLDLWAREHYKSTIITIGGIIQECLRDSDITVGIFSHTAPIAKGFLAQIKREIEGNSAMKAAFPDVLWSDPYKEAQQWSLDAGLILKRKSNPKEATIEAHGLVDAQPIGKHFKLMVYDDVVTDKSVYTPEQVQKTTQAWELSDNLSSVGGRKWHIGTRYSYADTYEAIIKKGSVVPRIYTATKNGLMDGDPVLFPPDVWEQKKRDQGEAVIACQMMQNPLSGTQRMFNIEDLQEYEIRPETLNVYILIDPARSRKKDSANTAMVVIGVDYASNKYLLDGMNHKMDLQERWQNMRLLWAKWKQAPGVQSLRIGYESFGAIADMDYFKERISTERIPMQIDEVQWPREGPGSKIDRVQRLGPDLRMHRFYLPYQTDPKKLTRNQRDMEAQGYGYRVAKMIKRKDENGNIYDVSEQFKTQLHYFPFGGLKDLVDAASRIYDIEHTAPSFNEPSYLEPEYS